MILRNLAIKITEEGRRRTPRIHSRYKSSTRLRWWMEFVDTVATRARRVGIVVIGLSSSSQSQISLRTVTDSWLTLPDFPATS